MSFRHDSDIFMPYGRISQTQSPPADENVEAAIKEFGETNAAKLVGKKSKPIAWFVSNCETPSNRVAYARALQKHMKVDIYGACGHLKCERSRESDCWKQIEDDYYFYLAFENSICTDYVTEKFFNAMNHLVVPVVLGGYDYNKHAPPKSVIHAYQDYKVYDIQWTRP